MSYYIITMEKTERGYRNVCFKTESRATAYRKKRDYLEGSDGFAWGKIVDYAEALEFCDHLDMDMPETGWEVNITDGE